MAMPEHDATVHCARCGRRLVDGACADPYCTVQRLRTTSARDVSVAAPDGDRPRPAWWLGLLAVALVALAVSALSVLVALRTDQGVSAARAGLARDAAERDELRSRLQDMETTEARLRSSVRRLQTRFDETPDDSAVARTAGRSVVTVVTSAGSGSGFAIGDDDGATQLVTNFHVVAADYTAGRRTVTVSRGHSRWQGRVVEVSPGNDLAVIELHHHLPSLAVAGSRSDVGDAVLVLGSPLGLGGTVTSGIVSAYRDDFDVDYLQFSAPISPGNSGGPVLDERGRVVGVAVAKMVMTGAEGIGFAIPASRLCIALSVC